MGDSIREDHRQWRPSSSKNRKKELLVPHRMDKRKNKESTMTEWAVQLSVFLPCYVCVILFVVILCARGWFLNIWILEYSKISRTVLKADTNLPLFSPGK